MNYFYSRKPVDDWPPLYKTSEQGVQSLTDAAQRALSMAHDWGTYSETLNKAIAHFDEVYICELIYDVKHKRYIQDKGKYLGTVLSNEFRKWGII